jgi:zinc transporter ZupT
MSVPKALLFNVASGLSSVLGAVIAVAIGSTQDGATLNRDSGRMLAFSCGILLYVSFGLTSEIPKVSGKGASLGAWLSLSLGVIVIGLASTLWHVHCDACGGHAHDAHDH